jgi:hypothetical protein
VPDQTELPRSESDAEVLDAVRVLDGRVAGLLERVLAKLADEPVIVNRAT